MESSCYSNSAPQFILANSGNHRKVLVPLLIIKAPDIIPYIYQAVKEMHTDRRPYSPEWDYMLILKTQDFFF